MDADTLMGFGRLLVQVAGIAVAVVLAFLGGIWGLFMFFHKQNEKAHDGIVKNIDRVETRLAGDLQVVQGDVKEILKRLPPSA